MTNPLSPPLACVGLRREGVTNREIHEMIRQHVSRFVPSLKTKSLLKTTQVAMTAPAKATTAVGGETAADGGGAAGTPSSSSPLVATESVENDCMLVDENESQEPVVLQEAGISSTRCVWGGIQRIVVRVRERPYDAISCKFLFYFLLVRISHVLIAFVNVCQHTFACSLDMGSM